MSVDTKIEINWHKKIKTGTIYVDGVIHSFPCSIKEIHETIDKIIGRT